MQKQLIQVECKHLRQPLYLSVIFIFRC